MSQGRPGGRPLRDSTMAKMLEMVGHHHPFVQLDFMPNFAGLHPFAGNDVPEGVQPHFPVVYIAEQAGAPLRAERDEIRARLRVVPSFQPDGFAPS